MRVISELSTLAQHHDFPLPQYLAATDLHSPPHFSLRLLTQAKPSQLERVFYEMMQRTNEDSFSATD